jgi:serine/threonine-protein kinase
MSIDTQRWQRVGAIFDAVVDAPAEQRALLLEQLCGADAQLRDEVEALLRADAAATGFERGVSSARGAAARDWSESGEHAASRIGARVGPWRVLRELGRGGMGIVLLAERADGQFEQRAALKLIKLGMDSDAVLARFLRERQILARLEHPHIARLLDGGIADDGRPYFAMEYVDGQPLLQYCAQRSMKMEERIRLFLDICTAVQFAHGQLVVHRDIKPSNVLVTADGNAKLLDFGIAKLLAADEGGEATATALWHDRPLTPAYAAPEQLRGEPATVATDVYGLGCMLYELLTAQTPFEVGEAPTLEQIQKLLEATSPRAPSQAVANGGVVSARQLRGDLDTIVLKALKREPERRYATVDAFSADLRNFISGRPIAARRDHSLYRMRKFIGRHRLGVAISTLAVLALIASTGVAVWQARAKAREAQASAEVTRFLLGLFQGADPTLARGATVTAQDLLDQGSKRLRSDERIEPAVRARLLHTIAATYVSLGLYDRALGPAQEAVDLRRGDSAPDQTDVAESLNQLGRIQRLKADYVQAEPLLRESLRIRRARLQPDDPAVIESLGDVGALLRARGDFQAADTPLREALDAAQHHFGSDSSETAHRLDDYAANLDDLGKRNDAAVAYRRALAIREKNLGPDDAEVATSLLNLGVHLDESGEYAEAVTLLERAVTSRRKIYGSNHPLVGFAELGLAGVYESLDRVDDSERDANAALEIFRATLPAAHPKISEALNMLAVVHMVRRDYAGAIPLAQEVVARFVETLGADHPDTLTAKNNLAYALLHVGKLREAEQLQREVLANLRQDNGQANSATDMQNLAGTLVSEGKTAEAVSFAQRSFDLQRVREGEISGNVAVALRVLASAEESDGDNKAAERDFRAALDMGRQLAAPKGISIYGWEVPLAAFLAGKQRCDEAIPLLESALDELKKAQATADPQWQPEAQLLFAYCQPGSAQRGEKAQAMSSARQALQRMPGIEFDLCPTALKLLAQR